MNIIFIEEDDREKKLLKEKIIDVYSKLMGNNEIKYISNEGYKNTAINRIIVRIPNYNFEKMNNKSLRDKFIKKLIYRVRQNGGKNIVLSKKLKEGQNLKSELIDYGYNILDGRNLIKNSCIEIINYIMEKAGTDLKQEEISILVNNNNTDNINLITKIANNARRTNIISENISKFKKIQNALYEESGIVLSVGNNKKKGLARSKYIINVDFTEELINGYKILKRATILNLEHKLKIVSKSFSGIVINDIKIDYNENEEEKKQFYKFEKNQIYEAKLLALEDGNKKGLKEKDSFKIIGTIGNNGDINEGEYKLIKNLP